MVVNVKRILWPTDFSELSLKGGHCARALCQLFDAELHIIHVIPPLPTPDFSVMMPGNLPVAVPEPDLVVSARQGLERLIAEHFAAGPRFVYDAFLGNPWSGICEYAARARIDLIVVATHGRTGLKHVVIGSTAERIVQHAPCPVLTVKNLGQGDSSE
jgi:universal stress protein A